MVNNPLDQLKRDYEEGILKWQRSHLSRILSELKQAQIDLSLDNLDRIIEFTNYSTRSKNHPDSCPCYSSENKCHQGIAELNCFLCACPNYSLPLPGICKIDHKPRSYFKDHNIPGGSVMDCSDCLIPHRQDYLKVFLRFHLKELKALQDSI